MRGRHYDVIVLGRGMGSLVAAALLARRDFSVLVMGQESRPASYRYGAHTLRRRTFSLLGASSPALRRVLVELAQSQTFRRRTTPIDPMLSVLMPGRRFELPPDLSLFEREISREFPEIKRVVDELYATLAGVNETADIAFGRDITWPPGTFWERRATARVTDEVPFLQASAPTDLCTDFPRFHPYRSVVDGTAAFATDLWPGARGLTAFATARLHGAWTRGVVTLPGGEDELTQFLLDRLAAHGGNVAPTERAEKIVATRAGVRGVHVAGDTTLTGCRFLLYERSGEELAALASGSGVTARALRDWPEVTPVAGRFVVSLVLHRDGLPEPLGVESLLFGSPPGGRVDPRRPLVRLQRADLEPDGEHALLVAEAILPLRGALPLTEARHAILGTLLQYLPWLERHLAVVDSPHDGLSVWVYEKGKRHEVDRLKLDGGSVRAEPMESQFGTSSPSFHGLAGEPVRGPIERTFLVGKTVLPALGQEGELLAACSAARLVTKSDPRREKMRLEMWNKVEIG